MSYTPTTWVTGDTVTASAMNKIENGIANAGGDVAVVAIDLTGYSGYTVEFCIALCAEETHSNHTALVVKSEIAFFAMVGGGYVLNFAPLKYIPSGMVVCLYDVLDVLYGENISTAGALSQSNLKVQEWNGTDWSSLSSTAWIINGSGMLTIADNE